MKTSLQFLRTTIVGGVLFLVPIILAVAVIGKALEIANKIVAPLAALIPVESVGGIRAAKLLAIGAIVLFCSLAGFFAKTTLAKKIVNWLESALLLNLPGYEFMKGMAESIVGI